MVRSRDTIEMIEWCKSHREALEVMIYLHDRYTDVDAYMRQMACEPQKT